MHRSHKADFKPFYKKRLLYAMNKLQRLTYLSMPSGSVCPFCTIFSAPQMRT